MIRIVRILWLRVKLSFGEAMHDRVDFALMLLGDLLVVSVHLIGVLLLFQHTGTINGWTSDGALVVLGFYQVIEGLSDLTLHDNLKNFPRMVRFGQLDAILTQPVDIQLNLIRRFTFVDFGEIAAAFFLIGYGLNRLHIGWDPATVGVIILCIVIGYGFSWSLHFLFSAFGFWLIRNDNLVHLVYTLQSMGRLPTSVYGAASNGIMRFVLPIAIVGTVPAELITQTGLTTSIGSTIAVTMVLVILSRWFFFWALKSYSSASG